MRKGFGACGGLCNQAFVAVRIQERPAPYPRLVPEAEQEAQPLGRGLGVESSMTLLEPGAERAETTRRVLRTAGSESYITTPSQMKNVGSWVR